MKKIPGAYILMYIAFLLTVASLFSSCANNSEYQFVVNDSMITVYDNNRIVGTVKIEGQLDSLIMLDNQ